MKFSKIEYAKFMIVFYVLVQSIYISFAQELENSALMPEPLSNIVWSHNANLLAVGLESEVRFYTADLQSYFSMIDNNTPADGITWLAWNPDDSMILTVEPNDELLHIWNVDKENEIITSVAEIASTSSSNYLLRSATWNHTGSKIATLRLFQPEGNSKIFGIIEIVDVATWSVIQTLDLQFPFPSMLINWSPDDTQLAISSDTCDTMESAGLCNQPTISIIDITTEDVIWNRDELSVIYTFGWNNSGSKLVYSNTEIHVVNLVSNELNQWHIESPVYTAPFYVNWYGNNLIVTDEQGGISLFQDNGELINYLQAVEFPDKIVGVDITENDNRLALITREHQIQIWILPDICSTPTCLMAPILSSISDTTDTSPTLIWSAVSGTDSYMLSVSSTSTSVQESFVAANICLSAECSTNLSQELLPDTYSAAVQASNSTATSEWSNTITFTILPSVECDAEITSTDVSGLISAINSANSDPDSTTICLQSGTYLFTNYNNDTEGQNALPAITTDVTIIGNGATLERSSSSTDPYRFFFVSSTGHLTLEDITLTGGEAHAQAGGAIRVQGGQLTLNNTTLSDNNSIYDGGALYISGNSTVTSTNSTMLNNSSDDNGGTLYATGNNNINLIMTSISGSSAIYDGGAIVSYGGSISLEGSQLKGNSATSGGAVSVTDGLLNISGTSFTNNTAISDGGALSLWHSTLNSTNSTLLNNMSDNNGGTISSSGNSDLSLIMTTISGSHADYDGGAIYSYTDTIMLENSQMVNNTATDVGGAILLIEGNLTSENTDFLNNSADNAGGAVALYGASFNSTDDLLSGNTAINRGGGLYVIGNGTASLTNAELLENTSIRGGAGDFSSSSLTLNGSTLSNNEATSYGGAISVWNSTLASTNSTMINNSSDDSGGTLYATGNNDVSLMMTTISGSSTLYDGGAIVSYGGSISLEDSHLKGNSATSGGAIALTEAILNISGTSFNNNTAISGGGALSSWHSTITSNNSILLSNTSDDNGGAISISGSSDLNLSLTAISGSYSDYGGAIYSYTDTITLEDSQLVSNSASDIAGAIELINGTLISDDSHFVNNHATNAGGAIVLYGGSINLSNNQVMDNSTNTGGAILASGGTFSSANTTYTNNTAGDTGGVLTMYSGTFSSDTDVMTDNTASGHAGALYLNNGTTLTLMDSTFTDNTSGNKGGAVYIAGAANIQNIDASGNSADDMGGAFYISSSALVSILDSDLSQNTAYKYGGALAINPGLVAISGTRLSDNMVTATSVNTGGGAIYSTQSSSEVSINNSMLEGNSSTHSGGAIWNESGDLTLTGSNVENNTASDDGGAVYVSQSNGVNLTDNRFASNTATTGGGLYFNGSSPTLVFNNCIVGNNASSTAGLYSNTSMIAENNWWGASDGPSGSGSGSGDEVSGNVDFDPYLTSEPGGCPPAMSLLNSSTSSNLMVTNLETALVDQSKQKLLDTPVLLNPISSTLTLEASQSVQFTWQAVPGATAYQVAIDGFSSRGLARQLLDSSSLQCEDDAICSFTPNRSFASGTYTWQVRARNKNTFSYWSESAQFDIETNTVNTGVPILDDFKTLIPNLIQPVSATVTLNTSQPIVFEWQSVAEANAYELLVYEQSYGEHYRWFTDTGISCDATICEWTPPFAFTSGSYVWQVRTHKDDTVGLWSEMKSFTVDITDDSGEKITNSVTNATQDFRTSIPELIQPVGVTIAGKSPQPIIFEWQSVGQASAYELVVYDNSHDKRQRMMISADSACAGSSCKVSSSVALDAGNYVWQVRVHETGLVGRWSDRKAFNIILD